MATIRVRVSGEWDELRTEENENAQDEKPIQDARSDGRSPRRRSPNSTAYYEKTETNNVGQWKQRDQRIYARLHVDK